MNKRIATVVVAFNLVALLTGCGSSGSGGKSPPTPSAPGAAGAVILMQNMKFEPATLDIQAGTTVRWENADQMAHSVYEGVPNSGEYRFNSSNLTPGKTFSYKFDKPGTYQIFCNTGGHYMAGMKMEVAVH